MHQQKKRNTKKWIQQKKKSFETDSGYSIRQIKLQTKTKNPNNLKASLQKQKKTHWDKKKQENQENLPKKKNFKKIPKMKLKHCLLVFKKMKSEKQASGRKMFG